MRNLTLGLLAMSCLLCSSCASLPSAEQLEKWKANTDKALAAAATIADAAKNGADFAKAKIAELEARQAGIIAEVEALAGPLDQDGDGDVTAKEAVAVYTELKKTPEGESLLANWETYAAILATVFGVGLGKKPAQALLAKVHATGRALVDRDGDGKPDA